MMDLEQLKTQWSRLSIKVDLLEKENRRLAAELATGRATSAKQKLVNRFKLHAFWGLILPFLSPALVYVIGLPVWVAVLYSLFGILCTLVNYGLVIYTKRNDFTTQPVVKSLENILKLKKLQRNIRFFLIVLGVLFLSFAFYPFIQNEPHILIGAGAGLVVGIILGLMEYNKNVRLINEILQELRESINPKCENSESDDIS